MPSAEEILKGPSKRKEDKPKTKKTKKDPKAEHVDAHVHVTDVTASGVRIEAVDAFPVKPQPWTRPVRHALNGHGRSAAVPTGFSLHHRFAGNGRPIDGPFFSVPAA